MCFKAIVENYIRDRHNRRDGQRGFPGASGGVVGS